MNENFEPQFNENQTETVQTPVAEPLVLAQENVFAGTIGALLFSLAGGIIWFVLYQIGFLAAISGIVGVVCAIKGYSIFGKRESVKGVVISTIMAFLMIVLAWYVCLSYDVYLAYQEWYANGEVDYTVTIFEAVANAYIFLTDGEIALAYLKDLGIGLVFCVVGAFGYVKAAVGKAKSN